MLEGQFGKNDLDRNAVEFAISTAENSLEALERQKEQVSESSVFSVDAQIREKQKELADLRGQLDKF
jgi:hypothetical protein